MIDSQSYDQLKQELRERMLEDRAVLDELREDVRPLRSQVRRIQSRSATAISLVGTDGGNNRLQFDPFLVQLIRVVDSSNNEYCLEAITPTTNITILSARQFDEDGSPRTALGRMMAYLNIKSLSRLSPMIPSSDNDRPISPSWVQVYRELVEWAILFDIVRNKDYGTDTLIVFDGLLRSKVFTGDLFAKYREGLSEGIESHAKKRRNLYIAGVAKHSQVLARYRLAMALENVLTTDYAAYLDVPRQLEMNVYKWGEYARGDDTEISGEINKFVGGKMFFVKFGSSRFDPIWPIDIYVPQAAQAQTILGYMLADAEGGFPVPWYPRCLQKAHENAALVDFDMNILQDQIFDAIRESLAADARLFDEFRLQDIDPSQKRYQ